MAESFYAEFSFFKAGQGAFYGGFIQKLNNGGYWNIIYDCGTNHFVSGCKVSLKIEIDYYKRYIVGPDKTIDILFISHFDYDHVSGVLRLLTECEVKKIVIPYFPEEIRKFLIASFSQDGENNPNDFNLDLYFEFLNNPARFILNNSSNKNIEIIIVHGGEEKQELVYQNPNEPLPGKENILVIGALYEGFQTEKDKDSRIKHFKNNLQLFIDIKWEFIPFVKQLSPANFNNIKTAFNKLLGCPLNSEIDTEKIKDLVSTSRKKAHRIYKKHLPDINEYSLLLLHGPTNCNFIEEHFRYNLPFNDHFRYKLYRYNSTLLYRRHHKESYLSTLLMGDSSIGVNYTPFPDYFANKLENVTIFQLPHHGAQKNWNIRNYINIFRNNYYTPEFNVCNFGYGNRYGHPSYRVIADLLPELFYNTQFSIFRNSMKVHYH